MKKAVMLCRPALCVLAGLFAGCGTLVLPQQQADEDPGLAKQEAAHRRAEALAQYSMAIREGLVGDEEEVVNRYRAAIEADPDELDLQIELAVLFLHGGRYPELDELVDSILASNPQNVRALRLKSFSYRLRGRLRDALPPIESVIKLEPKELTHYVEAASIYNRLGENDAASALLEKATTTATNRLDAFHALAQLYIEQAKKQDKSGEMASATKLEIIELATIDYPDDALLLAQFGDLLLLNDKFEQAIDVFARVEAMRPADPAIQQKLASSLLSIGDRQKAISILEEIAAKQPQNRRLLTYVAELYQIEGDLDNAAASFEKAIELQPDSPQTYLQFAHLLMMNDRYDDAIELLQRARVNIPDDHQLTELLAFSLAAKKDFVASAEIYKLAEEQITALKSTPILKSFFTSAAVAHQLSGNTDEAVRLLTKGTELNPRAINDYISYALRGRKGSQRLQTSIDVLKLIPDNVLESRATRTMLGLLALKAEDYPLAVESFQGAETIARQTGAEDELDVQFYFWTGSALERNKEYDRAEEYFMKALELQPDHADSLNYVAYMNAERDMKLQEGLEQVGLALAMEPENPAYIDTRGWIYYKLGEYEKALEDIAFAAEKIPEDPTIADHLGDIHLALGNEEEAIIWWKKAYAQEPTNEAIKEKLIAHGQSIEEIPVNAASVSEEDEDEASDDADRVAPDEGDDSEEIDFDSMEEEILEISPETNEEMELELHE